MKFDLVGLFVEDIRKMIAFYSDAFALEANWDGGSYAEFRHEGIRFAMYERKKLPALLGQTPEYPARLNGTFELSINVGAKEQVDVFFSAVLAKGAREIYPPRDEPWKMRSAMVADPEGNLIEIASDFWT